MNLPPMPPLPFPCSSSSREEIQSYAEQYGRLCAEAERARWIGFHVAMRNVDPGSSLTLDEGMAEMAAAVNAEHRARGTR